MRNFNNTGFTYFDDEPKDPEPKEPESFSQEDVTKLVEVEKAKFQEERTKMVKQLEEIQKTATLNGEQKAELEEQVTALREASMTVEERSKAALERKEQDYANKVQSLESERNSWEQKYTQTRIRNAIVSAAGSNEMQPFHSDDIFNALGPDTYLKERVDELGKKTGDFDVRVKFTSIDDDGKSEVIDMEPRQAVGQMCKMNRWKHLFQNKKKAGTGGYASANKGEVDLAKLAATDTKKFLELTKEHPELLN